MKKRIHPFRQNFSKRHHDNQPQMLIHIFHHSMHHMRLPLHMDNMLVFRPVTVFLQRMIFSKNNMHNNNRKLLQLPVRQPFICQVQIIHTVTVIIIVDKTTLHRIWHSFQIIIRCLIHGRAKHGDIYRYFNVQRMIFDTRRIIGEKKIYEFNEIIRWPEWQSLCLIIYYKQNLNPFIHSAHFVI